MIVGISEAQEKIIREILKPYLDEFAFFYYGSRVKGGFEATSDLDILIKGKAKMPRETLEQIKEKFDQSLLPFIVNLSDYFAVEQKFYEAIKIDLERIGGGLEVGRRQIKDLIAEGAILKVQDGNHGEKHPTAADYVEKGIPFLMARDFTDNRLDLSSACKIPKELGDSLRIGFAKSGDVLLTHKGTIGLVAVLPHVPDYVMLTPQVTYYRTNPKKLLNDYLKYAFQSPFFCHQLYSFSAQSTRPYISITLQKELYVDIPALPTQQKIASILSAYDDLIENNNRRIKILEEIAQKLYKEWFVDFKFPGHQNAKFIDSTLGKIPEGWEIKELKDFGAIHTGKTPSTKNPENFGNFMPFIKTPDMHGGMFCIQTNESLSESGSVSQKNKILPPNSLCVSCIGTVGIVSITTKDSQTNQQINSIVLDKIEMREFLYFTLLGLKETIMRYGSIGATMANLSKGKFEELKTVCPQNDLIFNYSKITKPIFDEIRILLLKNQTLRQTRDLLLPRLISGELSVENLEVKI